MVIRAPRRKTVDRPGAPRPWFVTARAPRTRYAAWGRAAVGVCVSAAHATEQPAGDVQGLPVDIVGPRRAQEEDASGGLVGAGGSTERDQHGGPLGHLLGDAELDRLPVLLHGVLVDLGLREARVDEAEGDGVDVDLELAPLLGDRFREPHDSGLAG